MVGLSWTAGLHLPKQNVALELRRLLLETDLELNGRIASSWVFLVVNKTSKQEYFGAVVR